MANPRPFNIRIFVAEGLPDGLRLVEKSNWVGLGVICPRGRYPAVKKRSEFSGSGVYILWGRDDEVELPVLYIGEAETVRTRLDSVKGVRLRFVYEVHRDGDLLATGFTVLAAADTSGRPRRLPPELAEMLATGAAAGSDASAASNAASARERS